MNVTLVLIRVVLALCLVVAVLWLAAHRELLDPAVLHERVVGAGVWASVFFVFLYAVAVVACVPASVFTIAGGAIFGPWFGTVYSLAGGLAGASIAFLISRHVASGWVRRRLGGRLGQILASAEAEGWRFVAFTRLVPVFPFCVISYAFGVTRVRFSHYFAATLAFVIPGMYAFTYAGYAGREVWSGDEGAYGKMFVALALIAVLIFVPRFMRRLRARPAPGDS